ncbi:MAG: hypothetical protein SFV21_15640 [Rhodospirillaceae bacterium]|nr:hypothetical protein [Rhodospirillaceae bacterium]
MPRNVRVVFYLAILGLALYAYYRPGTDLRPPQPAPETAAPEVPAAPPAPVAESRQLAPFPEDVPIADTGPLGIRREAIQSSFERTPFSLTFEYKPYGDGRSRTRGRNADGTAQLDLVGPPEALTAVVLAARMDDDNRLAQLKNANALANLAKLALPDWAESAGWVTSGISAALAGARPTTTVDGNVLTLSSPPNSKIVVFTITGPPR